MPGGFGAVGVLEAAEFGEFGVVDLVGGVLVSEGGMEGWGGW